MIVLTDKEYKELLYSSYLLDGYKRYYGDEEEYYIIDDICERSCFDSLEDIVNNEIKEIKEESKERDPEREVVPVRKRNLLLLLNGFLMNQALEEFSVYKWADYDSALDAFVEEHLGDDSKRIWDVAKAECEEWIENEEENE